MKMLHPRPHWYWAAAPLLAVLLGCAAPAPAPPPPTVPAAVTAAATLPRPTPTARPSQVPAPTLPSYVPPPTAAPRPTATATPPPTGTPAAFFPPQAAVPDGYPALPDDLYFLQAGLLWRWPAAGGPLETVAGEGEMGPIAGYWLAGGGRWVAYVSEAETLSLLDRATGERLAVPVQGTLHISFDAMGNPGRLPLQEYALTPDGHYLLYLAWGAAPGEGAGDALSAALLAVDTQHPEQATVLGACLSDMNDWEQPRPCRGFSVSVDGTQVAWADSRGLWLAEVAGGSPRLLVERSGNIMPHRCDVNYPLALRWSPDGRRLLARVGCYEGAYWTVVDTATGRLIHFPADTFCYVSCRNDARWGPAGIWLGQEGLDAAEGLRGKLLRAALTGGETLTVSWQISQTAAGPLRPAALGPFPDGRVGFAQRGCEGAAGPAAAIYILEPTGTLREVARLPSEPCPAASGEALLWGTTPIAVLWSADGAAYLYLEQEAVLLGRTDGTALWDVRTLLRGASQFRWATRP